MTKKSLVFISILILIPSILIVYHYVPKYESEILVTKYSKEKGFIVGKVINSNHLPAETIVNCAIPTEKNTNMTDVLNKKNVYIIIKYNKTQNEELLAMYPFNPVDLIDVKNIEIK